MTWRDSDFTGNKLPKSLDGVSVKVNGKDAAVYYISFYRFDARQVDRIGTVAGKLWSGFSVRRDGGSILWLQEDLHTSDLMLIEPLRVSW